MYCYDTLINIIIKYKNKIIILVYRYDTPYVSLRYTDKTLIKKLKIYGKEEQ